MSDLRPLVSRAALLAVLLATACSIDSGVPENNVGFFLRSNLPCVRAEVNGLDSTLVIASALPKSAIHSSLRGDRDRTRILLGSTLLTTVRPAGLDIAEIPADGFLGADAFRGKIATLDYAQGVLIISAWPRVRREVTPWSFAGGPPRVPVRINGRETWAVVDSALPDTAVIPPELLEPGSGDRATIKLEVSGVRFDDLDVAVVPVVAPRIGNRVLARFVVTIDYAHEMIGLWPDPRTANTARR